MVEKDRAGHEAGRGNGAQKRRGYFLPGVIALAVLVILGIVLGGGDLEHPAATTLNGADVSQQLAQSIQVQQGDSKEPQVTCPGREPVRRGLRFQCQLAQGARTRAVYVTEIDSRGEIRWSLTAP